MTAPARKAYHWGVSHCGGLVWVVALLYAVLVVRCVLLIALWECCAEVMLAFRPFTSAAIIPILWVLESL